MEIDVLQMSKIGKPPMQRHLGVLVPSGEVDIAEIQGLLRRGDFVFKPKGQGGKGKARGDSGGKD